MGTVRTEALDGTGSNRSTEKILGKVLTDPPYRGSIYVRIFKIDRDRRTDGGAADPNTGIEYNTDCINDTYSRGDYVYLTFEPQKYNEDAHILTEVERATVQAPTQINEPTFDGSNIPIKCPKCGKIGVAIVKTRYNGTTGGQVNKESAEYCTLDPENRGAWFDLSSEWSIIH